MEKTDYTAAKILVTEGIKDILNAIKINVTLGHANGKPIIAQMSMNEKSEEYVAKLIEDYAQQESDKVQKLFSKPAEQLKPLEDLYRKANPRKNGKYYLPDTKTFYKWITENFIKYYKD